MLQVNGVTGLSCYTSDPKFVKYLPSDRQKTRDRWPPGKNSPNEGREPLRVVIAHGIRANVLVANCSKPTLAVSADLLGQKLAAVAHAGTDVGAPAEPGHFVLGLPLFERCFETIGNFRVLAGEIL